MTSGPLLVRNVRIVPLDPAAAPAPEPVDLLLVDGVIAQVLPAGAGTPTTKVLEAQIIEAEGRWAIPGLWDHHVHLGQWAKTQGRLDLAGTASAAEALSRVADRIAADRAAGTTSLPLVSLPLVGFGHRSARWPTPPTVAALDAITGERPVVLISGDAHNGWVNTAALRLLDLPDRVGALEEDEWFAAFTRFSALPSDRAAATAGYPKAVAHAASLGVVGITDFEWEAGFAAWPERFASGVQALRVRTATYADTLDDAIAAGLRTGDPLPGCGGLVRMGPLKVISDGSLNTRTAYCSEPYADSANLADPCGKLNIATGDLTELLAHARRHGIDAAVHAIGDAAVGSALDALAGAGARGSIEHAQLVHPADVARLAGLGITASVQPAHLPDDRDVSDACWPDRGDRCFPLRSMLDAGVRLALGSDAPVAALNPWEAMACAVHRSADERGPWHPREAITAREALAASVDGQRLRVGAPADVVLLDDDPLAGDVSPRDYPDSGVAASRLRAMRVHATIRTGELTHR